MELPSQEEFKFIDCNLSGDDCFLIIPKQCGVLWTDENSRFRSVILRKSDNHVISQGFRKFMNFGERPSFEPWNEEWPIHARRKFDGSLLILSKYKGELIVRTRGSTDISGMANSAEIERLKSVYPYAFDNEWLDSEKYSLLFEWMSPANIIVLRECEVPTLRLVGIVENESGKYLNQYYLDAVGETILVPRPIIYEFKSISECVKEVDTWNDKEGVVICSPDGQTLKKIKAKYYCDLHRLAAGLSTLNGVYTTFIAAPRLYDTTEQFYAYMEQIADFEIATRNRPLIAEVVNTYASVKKDMLRAEAFVNELIGTSLSIPEKARRISAKFSGSAAGFAFRYLHNKHIEREQIHKAIRAKLKYDE